MKVPDGIQLTAFDEEFHADPYPVYERLRRLDPVHKDVVSYYRESWTISDYRIVSRLLRDDRLSVDPRTIGIRRDPRVDNAVTLRKPDMMNLDGPDHHRLRSLVQKAFTPSSVSRFTVRIEAIVDDCLDALTESTFDVVPTYSKPIPTIVIAEYIGVDSHDHAQFKKWTDSLLLQGYPTPSEAQWEEILAADQSLRNYVALVIEQRRKQPAEDLVTLLTLAQDNDDSLSSREIVDMCCLLIGAGNFTTTDLISNCIYHCIDKGHATTNMEELIDECLRFDTPVLSVRRFVTQDIEVGSTTVPKGSVVNLLLGASNHAPDQFDDPGRFLSERSPNHHLAFGRGVHHCLGASLAKLEVTIALRKFFERFPTAIVQSFKRSKRLDFRGFSRLVVKV